MLLHFITQGIIFLSKSLCVSLLLTVCILEALILWASEFVEIHSARVVFLEGFFHMYRLHWLRLLDSSPTTKHNFFLTRINKFKCKPMYLSLPFSAKYNVCCTLSAPQCLLESCKCLLQMLGFKKSLLVSTRLSNTVMRRWGHLVSLPEQVSLAELCGKQQVVSLLSRNLS